MFSFTLGFINSWGSFGSLPSPAFMSIFPLIFVFVGIGVIIYGIRNILTAPTRISALEAKKEEFFSNLKGQPKTKTHVESNSIEFRFCPHCGDKNDPGQNYCEKCGQDLIP